MRPEWRTDIGIYQDVDASQGEENANQPQLPPGRVPMMVVAMFMMMVLLTVPDRRAIIRATLDLWGIHANC